MDLTLNDFRSVLGAKNDGDVVMTLDKKGIEKANWGGLFSGLFNNIRKVTPTADANMQMRRALLAAVMRATDTFYVPSPRPDKDSKWVDKNNNGLDLLEAIYYNLQRGADALKVELGKMSDSAVNLAALNFGLADEKLAKSIYSLSNENYEKLLALAGQVEMNAANKPLTKALDALRNSKDLLTEVSKKAE